MPRIRVYGPDLVTDYGFLDQPFGVGYKRQRFGVGVGKFVIPHDSPVVQANPSVLDAENMCVVYDGDEPRFPFLIRQRNRERSDVWDPITVEGPGAIELMRSALVYPRGGLAGPPQDTRTFAWTAADYEQRAGWGPTASLGTYGSPSDPMLIGTPAEDGEEVNEVQKASIYAESPPFPWGNSYPSATLDGYWYLAFRGQRSGPLSWRTSLGSIKKALEKIPSIDEVTIRSKVGGHNNTPPQGVQSFEVEFSGPNLAGKQQDLLQIEHSGLRHSHSQTGVTRVQTGATGEGKEGEGLVPGWPDQGSAWMGRFGQKMHYRRMLQVPMSAEGPAIIHVVGMGDVDVWMDGDHLSRSGNLDLMRFRRDLYAVGHLIAIRADGPVMVSITRIDAEGNAGEVLYRSTGGHEWSAYGPGEPHGVTPGFIIRTLFDEAKARGWLPPITTDVSPKNDSLGRPWPTDLEVGLQVGTDSVLSTVERMVDIGAWGEFSFPDLVFRVYSGQRVDRGSAPEEGATTATVPLSAAGSLRAGSDDELLTTLLIRTSDTWTETHLPGIRREGFLSLGTALTVRSGLEIGSEVLGDMNASRSVIPWVTHSAQAVPVPEVDYDVGDVIVAPRLEHMAGDWSVSDVSVDTIAVAVDIRGSLYWAHETYPL